mgnify:CR=1 FL=1
MFVVLTDKAVEPSEKLSSYVLIKKDDESQHLLARGEDQQMRERMASDLLVYVALFMFVLVSCLA